MQPRIAILGVIAVALALTFTLMPASTADAADSVAVDSLRMIRYSAGTSSVSGDDVFILDADDSGEVNAGDVIVASGDDRWEAGTYIVESSQFTTLLEKDDDFEVNVVYADVDEDGEYSDGDWVFLSSEPDELPSSSSGFTEYSIRLTDTDEGDAGTALRTTDDDRQTWEDTVDNDLGEGTGDASFTWEDDGDGDFEEGEDAYIAPGPLDEGDSIPSLAINLMDFGASTPDDDPTEEPTEEVPENNAPVAELSVDVSSGRAPLEVEFSIDVTDADDDALTWSLDVDGDGTPDESGTEDDLPATFAFTYDDDGAYTATLTASDGTDEDTDEVSLDVDLSQEQPTPPTGGSDEEDDVGGAKKDGGIPGLPVALVAVSLLAVVAYWRK
jgi:PKD domain